MLPHHIDIINQSVVQFNIPSCQINIFFAEHCQWWSLLWNGKPRKTFIQKESFDAIQVRTDFNTIHDVSLMSVDFCVSGCVIDWFTTTSNNLSLFYGGKTVRSSLTIVQKKHFEQADSFFSYPSLFGRSSVACGSTGQMISMAQLSGVTLTNWLGRWGDQRSGGVPCKYIRIIESLPQLQYI